MLLYVAYFRGRYFYVFTFIYQLQFCPNWYAHGKPNIDGVPVTFITPPQVAGNKKREIPIRVTEITLSDNKRPRCFDKVVLVSYWLSDVQFIDSTVPKQSSRVYRFYHHYIKLQSINSVRKTRQEGQPVYNWGRDSLINCKKIIIIEFLASTKYYKSNTS